MTFSKSFHRCEEGVIADGFSGKYIQFNVVNRETLEKAQKKPERHRDLIVRIAGYSAYFTQLGKLCRDAGIHTAIETCGFAKWDVVKGILDYTDLVLYDIKHMNPLKHKEYAGVSNEHILENAKIIESFGLPTVLGG